MAQDSSAPVSGPGALSRRTDTGPAQKIRDLPDAQYGEAATYRDLQQSAPLAQQPAPGQSSATGGSPSGASPVIPLNAPTTRPNEPVTAGSAYGPGPGPEALGPQVPNGQASYQSAAEQITALAQQNPDNTALAYLAAKVRGRL